RAANWLALRRPTTILFLPRTAYVNFILSLLPDKALQLVDMINIIAAIGRSRELGKNNALLWTIPDDLKRFKALTTGHPIIMGRKTFESIGRPLPGRANIVVTQQGPSFNPARTVLAANSIEDALARARETEGGEEIFIIGGAQ